MNHLKIEKKTEVTGDLIGNDTTNNLTNNSPKNNSHTEQKPIFRLFN